MRLHLVAALLVVTTLAGCADDAPADTVVFSDNPAVSSDDESTAGTPASTEERHAQEGQLTGFVLDEALRPISGATVRLPGLDLSTKTDRDGVFAFGELWAGPYRVVVNATGHLGAETVVDVRDGDVTRIKFVLTIIPPAEPYHDTTKFIGQAEMTHGWLFSLGYCNVCEFRLGNDGNLSTLILEAVGDGAESMAGEPAAMSFRYTIEQDNEPILGGTGGNPLLVRLEADAPGLDPAAPFVLTVAPETFPTQQVDVEFEVFATMFYHGDAPSDWSFVAGDA